MTRDSEGAIQIEFLFAVGALLLPIAIMVLTIAPIVERKNVAGRAAAEAARAYAVADTPEDGMAAAAAIVAVIDRNHSYSINLQGVDGSFARGEFVTATVDVTLPAIVLPGVGDFGEVSYSATHQERIDLYRSFLP